MSDPDSENEVESDNDQLEYSECEYSSSDISEYSEEDGNVAENAKVSDFTANLADLSNLTSLLKTMKKEATDKPVEMYDPVCSPAYDPASPDIYDPVCPPTYGPTCSSTSDPASPLLYDLSPEATYNPGDVYAAVNGDATAKNMKKNGGDTADALVASVLATVLFSEHPHDGLENYTDSVLAYATLCPKKVPQAIQRVFELWTRLQNIPAPPPPLPPPRRQTHSSEPAPRSSATSDFILHPTSPRRRKRRSPSPQHRQLPPLFDPVVPYAHTQSQPSLEAQIQALSSQLGGGGAANSERSEEDMRTVYIGNIAYDGVYSELRDTFSQYGRIQKLYVKQKDRNDINGGLVGWGYCRYDTTISAEDAIHYLNGFEYRDRNLKVDTFQSRERGGNHDGYTQRHPSETRHNHHQQHGHFHSTRSRFRSSSPIRDTHKRKRRHDYEHDRDSDFAYEERDYY